MRKRSPVSFHAAFLLCACLFLSGFSGTSLSLGNAPSFPLSAISPVRVCAAEERNLTPEELRILRKAQSIYDQIMEPYSSTDNYIYAVRDRRNSFQTTLNNADFFNKVYDTNVNLSALGVNLLFAAYSNQFEGVITEFMNTALDYAVDEATKDWPEVSAKGFIYCTAKLGISMVKTTELQRIMNRTEKNGGQFRSIQDALDFIYIYEENRAGFAALKMGDSFYRSQLRAPIWEAALDVGVKVAISQLAGKVVADDLVNAYAIGKAGEQYVMFLQELALAFENPYITKYTEELIDIMEEIAAIYRNPEPRRNVQEDSLLWVNTAYYSVALPSSVFNFYDWEENSFEWTWSLNFYDKGYMNADDKYNHYRFSLMLCQYPSDVYDRQSYDALADVWIGEQKYTLLATYASQNELELRTLRRQIQEMMNTISWVSEDARMERRSNSSWRSVYEEFVTKRCFLYHDSFGDEIDYGSDMDYALKLYDMDQDGVPELLVGNGYGAAVLRCAYVYTCDNGTLRFMGRGPSSAYFRGDEAEGLFGEFRDSYFYEEWSFYTKKGNTLQRNSVCTIEREPDGTEKMTIEDGQESLASYVQEGTLEGLYPMLWEDINNQGFAAFLAAYGY